jgi:hypothetical protein
MHAHFGLCAADQPAAYYVHDTALLIVNSVGQYSAHAHHLFNIEVFLLCKPYDECLINIEVDAWGSA